MIPLGNLVGADYNPRCIDRESLNRLTRSYKEFGCVKPIVVNRRSGRVVAGHQGIKAAKRAGLTELPVMYVDLDDVREKALNIALNNQNLAGEWDFPKLTELLKELAGELDFDLTLTGFTPPEIGEMIPDMPGAPEIPEGADDVPEVIETDIKPGDIIELGRHRLMCGDSTDERNVRALMGSERAVLMATDPPYGAHTSKVNADHAELNRTRHWDEIEGDQFEDLELQKFLTSAFRAAADSALAENAAWYLWHAPKTQGFFAAAAAAADLLLHRQIIWVKPRLIMGHGHYHWRHELCFYGWRRGHMCPWYGDRKATTVWEVGSTAWGEYMGPNRVHPTQKPTELWTIPMQRNTRKGDLCYEPFAGSGTQFIAAELLDRTCYGMEIDPRYCEVTRQRYLKLKETG